MTKNRFNNKQNLIAINIAFIIAISVLILDLTAPLGIAGGVPYVALVICGCWMKYRYSLFLLALAASGLTVLGYFFSPMGSSSSWIVLTNRAYAIFVIWSTAFGFWWVLQTIEHKKLNLSDNFYQGHEHILSKNWTNSAISILLIIILCSSWVVIRQIQIETKEDLEKSLKASLSISQNGIERLFEQEKKSVKIWASTQEIVEITQELLQIPPTPDQLIKSQPQKKLREWLVPVLQMSNYRGYFIIDKNNISLASSRDSNIGTKNLLIKQNELLARAWAGETLTTLPQTSDVPLIDNRGRLIASLSTMFTVSPIRNNRGEVIALLTFRLDPDEHFSSIFSAVHIDKTSETYAFNHNGLLISESRFNDDLHRIGLLKHEHSDLNLEIRNPGVNLMLGETTSIARKKQPLTLMAQSAIQGNSGSNLDGYRDYRGVPVVGAWLWDDELGFGIATEVDVDEAFSTLNNTRFIIFLFLALTIFLMFAITALLNFGRKAVIKREAETRLILSSAGEGIYGLDLHGITTFINPAACKILGFTEKELIGQSMHKMAHHTHPDGSKYLVTDCPMHTTLKDGKQRHVETDVMWCKDGSPFAVEYTSTPTFDNNKLTGAVVIFKDITERKSAHESMRKAKEEAEKANRAKSEFLSSMSHELRTPMNAILGFAQVLQYNPKEPLTSQQQTSVDYILQGGKHLLALINEVLDLTKIETGKIELNFEEVNVCDIFSECLPIISAQADEKKISITTEQNTINNVIADYTRLKQVILNLLSNALKYNSENGTILLTCEDISSSTIRISVADTGKGIPVELQDKVFEPFNRLGAEMSTVEGTGIGLTIARQLVQAMHGNMDFRSNENTGTKFWIDLPSAEASTQPKPISISPPQDQPDNNMTLGSILYIEDNPANLKLMEVIVKSINGIQFLSSHNAELGLVMAKKHQPLLILMDINLPGMNGIEALSELKKSEETANIPVIALSAFAMQNDIDKGMQAGFKAYLTKPLNIAEVIEAIKEELHLSSQDFQI